MADESQALHDFLMTGIHQAMERYSESGMQESDAVQAMMTGLAGTVAETMTTLGLSFQPDDPNGASEFYKRFRAMVGRIMKEPITPPAPVKRTMVEPRGENDPVILRTIH